MSRFSLLLLLAATAWISTPATAASPPSLPLPPCVNGQGACLTLNPLLTGTASGTLNAGSSVILTTVPTGGVCNEMNGGTRVWTPSGCFAGISKPVILGCAYIDLNDMQFKETSCQQALYRTPSSAPAPLFTLRRPEGNTDFGGSTECGARGDYQTYIYGGAQNVPGAPWASRGERARVCELSMAGTRPDGLYGPTWIKVGVGMVWGETPLDRGGRGESAQFYFPVDGDLRPGVDVSVVATHELGESEGNPTLKLKLVVENKGALAASNVQVTFNLPQQLHILRSNEPSCNLGANFVGGTVICTFALPGKDDALGNNVRFLDFDTRIINASDFKGPAAQVVFKATTNNDADPSNNESQTSASLTLRSGSTNETASLLDALEQYFDFKTPNGLLDLQCDKYMNDIYARFNSLRIQFPEAFRNLAFGRITSGDYEVLGFLPAGHVGVVAYVKGTDYRQTGIVVHGTPTFSPADRDLQTRMGTLPAGAHRTLNILREGTSEHGLYYRTPLQNFPGAQKRPEAPLGCGYEGAYTGNHGEFRGAIPAACGTQISPQPTQSCPFFPDAVMVRTESPVNIQITNSRGQRLQTNGGEITMQQLDSRIFAYREPHADGTFGWTLALPKDRYDIALTGTGNGGAYTLTMRRYDTNRKQMDEVIKGSTVAGRVDSFVLDGAFTPVAPVTPAPPPPAADGGGNGGGGASGSGGGGSMDPRLLLGLGTLLLLMRSRIQRRTLT